MRLWHAIISTSKTVIGLSTRPAWTVEATAKRCAPLAGSRDKSRPIHPPANAGKYPF
jgi:hypothetical protein